MRKQASWVYLTGTLDAAIWGAELATGAGRERIYIVEPTGPIAFRALLQRSGTAGTTVMWGTVGLESCREAGRSYDRVAGNFVVGEDAQPPGPHVRRRDEDLWALAFSHRLKIDEALDQFFKRIDVERIEIVGRQIVRHRLEPDTQWRALEG